MRASVQYDDWEGTTAADDASPRSLGKLLEDRGLMDPQTEFLVAADLWIGESHDGKLASPAVHCLVTKGANYDDVATSLSNQSDPLTFRVIDVQLTLEEFLGLFKRFRVVLTRRGLELTDREY